MDLQPARPCASCPFRLAHVRVGCFPPESLDRTIGDALRTRDHLHRCHREEIYAKEGNASMVLCAGFLAFLHRQGELETMQIWRIGVRLDLLDLDRVDCEVPIHTCWEDVLVDHAACSGLPLPPSNT